MKEVMKVKSKYLWSFVAWLIIVLCFVVALVSCDKREDFFRENHQATTVDVRLLNNHSAVSATVDKTARTINDTVKLGFNYLFEFELSDKYPLVVEYIGSGNLYFQTASDFFIDFKKAELESGTYRFNWIPDSLTGAGNYTFSLSFTDIFGEKISYTFSMHVFFNRTPALTWSLNPVGEKGNLHYRFICSQEDGDQLYGGHILYYQVAVNQDTTIYQDYFMNYVFPKAGLYSIGVRAFDSNNEWSNFSQVSNYIVNEIEDDDGF